MQIDFTTVLVALFGGGVVGTGITSAFAWLRHRRNATDAAKREETERSWARVDALEARLDDANKARTEQERALGELTAHVEACERDRDSCEEHYSELQEEVADLKHQLARSRAEQHRANKRLRRDLARKMTPEAFSAAPPTLLHVEDDPAYANTFGRFIGAEDATIVRAARLEEALSLSDMTFDGIITDLILPDSEPLNTWQAMREAFPGVPILVLSVAADELPAEVRATIDLAEKNEHEPIQRWIRELRARVRKTKGDGDELGS